MESLQGKSKAEIVRSVVAAGSRALVKSLMISAIVLGPGFFLLIAGQTIAGMAWLFAGAFGQMAWSYRKPWRLGLVTCLIPPVMAGACYLIQLSFFNEVLPPLSWVIGAAAIGAVIGFARGRAHQLWVKDGAVFAQRTVMYLAIWAIAYAASQSIALVTTDLLAIRGGLVTGAMTTAMLLMVSVAILRNRRALLARASAILLLAGIGLFSLGNPAAASCGPAAKQVLNAMERALPAPSTVRRDQGVNVSRNPANHRGAAAYECAAGKTYLHARAFDFALNVRIIDLHNRENARRFYEQAVLPSAAPGTVIPSIGDFGGVASIAFRSGHGVSGKAETTRGRYFVSLGASATGQSQSLGRQKLEAFANQALQSGLQAFAGGIAVPGDQVASSSAPSGGAGAPSRPSSTPLPGPGGGVIGPERAAELAGAVAVILVAAGVAVSVAQAVAAAIASAIQAGVEVTVEDIRRAIGEVLRRSGAEAASGGEGRSAAPDLGGPSAQVDLENQDGNAPPNVSFTERVRPPTPIHQPDGTAFETNEDGQYWAPDENGDWGWLSQEEARASAAALRAEHNEREQERERHEAESGAMFEESRRETEARHAEERETEERERREREQASRDAASADRAATRFGLHEFLERSDPSRIYNEDGSIDSDYVGRLRGALYDRIRRDTTLPDSELRDNGLGRVLSEGLSGTMDGVSNSMIARGALGMATGGWSEAAIQGRGVWNAVQSAAHQATDRGQDFSVSDTARVVGREFARENLPINTVDALDRIRRGEEVSLAEVGMGAVADAFALADIGEAGGVRAGEAVEGIGRRVLSDEAFEAAAQAGGRIRSGVDDATGRMARGMDRANSWFDGVLEGQGIRRPPDRLGVDHAGVRFEEGRLTAETEAVINDTLGKPSPETAALDEAFHAGRQRGGERVQALTAAMEELDAAHAGGASPQELGRLERNLRDEVVRAQSDKHAMNELNRLGRETGGHPVISRFNGEMQRIYDEADRRMIQRLAQEYGVRPEDIQPVVITNMAGEAGVRVDPRAPARDHFGHASSWRSDGSIQSSRAAASAPDGAARPDPSGGGKPRDDKVSFDRDLTMRVRTVENGRVVYRDIPSTTTARIYNEEFYSAATGREVPSKRTFESGDGRGASSNPQGHSTDFKDTHLEVGDHLADPMAMTDPDKFARRMDQATTDRLHPEAYGTGQADLDAATKDAFRGRDLTDAAGTAKTIEFKVHHWMKEAEDLRRMARDPNLRPQQAQRLLEQAAAHHEEAQRQLVKQYGNMVVKRTGAMQQLANAPGSRIPQGLSEQINLLKRVQEGKLTPSQAEAALARIGTSTEGVAARMSAYVEGLQTLRSPSKPPGPKVVFQGWQDEVASDARQ